jgi:hypothetical protein
MSLEAVRESIEPSGNEDVEELYLELVRALYEDEYEGASHQLADRAAELLAKRPDVAESIRGEELRALVAEARRDLEEAIRRREAEVRKILDLHDMTRGTPGWDYVIQRYDYTDISDRLDLIAELYAEWGNPARAIETLEQSLAFCNAHNIRFEGADLLQRLLQGEG